MAPVMVLSSVSHHHDRCPVAPVTASYKQMVRQSKSFACRGGLLSDDRRLMLQFTSQALHLRAEQKHTLSVRSARAELAPNAVTGNVIDVKDVETMEKHLAESGQKLVVVDISTKMCGPCKLIFPKFVKLSQEYPDVLFLRIYGDLNDGTRALMKKWGVRAVPSFWIFQNGKKIHSHAGSKEQDLRAHFLTQYSATLNVTV